MKQDKGELTMTMENGNVFRISDVDTSSLCIEPKTRHYPFSDQGGVTGTLELTFEAKNTKWLSDVLSGKESRWDQFVNWLKACPLIRRTGSREKENPII